MAKRSEDLGGAKMIYKAFGFSSLTDIQIAAIFWKLFLSFIFF